MPNIMRLGGGGGVGLNIAYGTTPPTDTTKLWVPLAQKPANVEISGDSLQSAVDALRLMGSTLDSAFYAFSAVTINGKVYLFGGISSSQSNRIHEYDPATDTIIEKSARLVNTAAYTSAVVIDGKAYIFGGGVSETGSTTYNNIQEYDPVTDTITAKSATLTKKMLGTSAVAINGKAYIFGGRSSTTYYDYIQEYDPATDTIVTKPNVLASTSACGAAVAINGKAYIFGGENSSRVDTIQEYDPVGNTITTKSAVLVKAVKNISAVAINGKAYIFGGYHNSGYYDIIQEYDPATDTLITKSATLENTAHSTAAAVVDEKAYIFGGKTSGTEHRTIREYIPKAYLAENHLKVFGSVYRSAEHQVITNIVNGKKEQIKLYMTSAFIGDAEGYAMAQDAYVYDDVNSEWQALDGTSMTTDMLAALAELGVT